MVEIKKKDRYSESINATEKDVLYLYKAEIADRLISVLNKKIFNKEKKLIYDLRGVLAESQKAKCNYSQRNTALPFFIIYNDDGVGVQVREIILSKCGYDTAPSEVNDANKEIWDIVKKHDPMHINLIPKLEEVLNDYMSKSL